MQPYRDTVLSMVNGKLTPVSGASVLVKTYPGLATATIYSDNGVSTATNPLTTDANGGYTFFAADGRYQIVISGSTIQTATIPEILLEDPSDGGGAVLQTVASLNSAVIYGLGSAGTCTYTTRQGQQIRIGDVVTFTIYLEWTGHTGTGDLTVDLFPYIPTHNCTFSGYVLGLTHDDGTVVPYHGAGTGEDIVFDVFKSDGTPSTIQIGAAGSILVTGSYFTSDPV